MFSFGHLIHLSLGLTFLLDANAIDENVVPKKNQSVIHRSSSLVLPTKIHSDKYSH